MDKIVLNRIDVALDKVIDDFKKDEESIFPDEKTRTTLKYENVKKLLEAWDKSKICIYKGCKEKSIPKSHSIQKSSSLKLIAENNHVTAIEFDTKAEKLAATKVGINIASTFPGFCEKHEGLFSGFETAKGIVAAEDFTLQFYRTVCREIVNKNYYIDVLEGRKRQYLAFRDKKLGEHLCNELGLDFISQHKINLKTLKFTYRDYRVSKLDQEIKNLKKDLQGFLYTFQSGILHDIQTKKNHKICGNILVLDIELPVCLAGRGNFQVAQKSKTRNIDVILNVLPYPNKTFIAVSALSKYSSELNFYIKRFSNPLETVNMVESWMVHGSDHWFIKSSIWDKIQPRYRDEMLKDVLDFSKNIGHKYRYSIFNDVKRFFLNIADKSDNRNISQAMQRILVEERTKLTD